MNYRNPKLLDHARNITRCAFCKCYAEAGSIVAAHSNESRHGKGGSIKAHDCFIAYLCPKCHAAVDEARNDRAASRLIWRLGHKNSIPMFAHLLTAEGWRLLHEEADHS